MAERIRHRTRRPARVGERTVGDGAPRDRAPFERVRVALTGVLVAFGMLASGANGLFSDIGVETLSLLLLALLIVQGPAGRVSRATWLLIGLVVAIPVLQLVPLPASLWTALPGREVPEAIERASGIPLGAHPFSLDPDATLRSALSLLPAFAVYLSVARAGVGERRALVAGVLAIAALSALLGVFQFSSGTAYLYDTPHAGLGTGLFVNRNQNADLVLAAIALTAALGRIAVPERRVFVAAGMLLLAFCCLATGSRMGIGLLPGVLAASLAILFIGRGRGGRAWPWLVAGLGVTALALGLVFTPALRPIFNRFGDAGHDSRFIYWQSVMVAIRDYFPFGSGVGSFVPVFVTVEDLDTVTHQYVNHAHNEYLEIALETGVFGLAALLLYLGLIARSAVGAFRGRDWPMRAGALVVVLVMLAHSVVEFPLRNFILLIVFALANALLTTAPGDARTPREQKNAPRGSITG